MESAYEDIKVVCLLEVSLKSLITQLKV